MMEVAGHPMLWHVISRLRRARLVNKVMVATTEKPVDDVIERLCENIGVDCYRDRKPMCWIGTTRRHVPYLLRLLSVSLPIVR